MTVRDATASPRAIGFFVGLFMVAASVTAMQILQARIISVVSWYSLAFLAISMAMLGLTLGSLMVYFRPERFRPAEVRHRLVQWSLYTAAAILLSGLLLMNSIVVSDIRLGLTALLSWAQLIVVVALPYIPAGVVVALALTRSSAPIGTVYAVDLIGAAAGCFVVLGLMSVMDGVSALITVAALVAVAAAAFAVDPAPGGAGGAPAPGLRTGRLARRAALLGLAVLAFAMFNAAIYPHGARLFMDKNRLIWPGAVESMEWNSFSRIHVTRPTTAPAVDPLPGEAAPPDAPTTVFRNLEIDGMASTPIHRYNGDPAEVAFLRTAITNLAYAIRDEGSAAVIGVGGGRDVLSAHLFGFRRIVGIELNPIIVRNLTETYRDFAGVADLPGVTIHVDDARSWFARSDDRFDLVQMSLIDTWAATGAGAHALAENGLYTVEGWRHFLGGLKPGGVFTVSRWYQPERVGETGRLVSLAKASLFDQGVARPNDHLYLAARGKLATIVVGRDALTAEDVARLDGFAQANGFTVLMRPGAVPENPVLADVAGAASTAALYALAAESDLNFAPPTDDSPFFFNQLKPSAVLSASLLLGESDGVVAGNLIATLMLMMIVALSGIAVLLTVVLPAVPSVRQADLGLSVVATGWFLMIGVGFMFVEIALMQRLSVFLGHPVYGLSVALAGIIVATGVGSAVSERFALDTPRRLAMWVGATVLYVGALPLFLPGLLTLAEPTWIAVRAFVALMAVLPAGILMGYGFPTGMRLVEARDRRPTPWFWAVNGAAGVLGSGIAVAVGTFASINVTFWAAAVCYAVLLPLGLLLMPSARRVEQTATAADAAAATPAE
ncbi:MAG: hypothetical protein AAF677_04715 [Pseudomonadota bacterium]